jgi:hypothetical protein
MQILKRYKRLSIILRVFIPFVNLNAEEGAILNHLKINKQAKQ